MMKAVRAFCLLCAVWGLCLACSVKEERSGCPCYAEVDVGGFISAGFSRALLFFSAEEPLLEEEINLREYEDDAYVTPLERRTNRAAVVAGVENSRIADDILSVPSGLEADPIWAFGETFFCGGDAYLIKAAPHKQYCNMEISVAGLDAADLYEFSFRVIADCNGLKLYDRTAVEGAYSCFARRSATGAFNVRIPRQSGGRILLEVYRDSSPDVQEPVLVTEVGAEMLRNGYDWSREDLLDVSVGLDYSAAEVAIKIKDWIYDEFWNVQI